MGSELVSGSQPLKGVESYKGFTPVSFSEQFYNHLPFYLAIGMTLDEYFNQDCTLVRYFRKAHKLKQKQRNQELWLQGLYIYEAIGDMTPVLHAFSKKGAKPVPYPNEPYPLTLKEVEDKKKREEETKTSLMKAKVAAWAAKVNNDKASKAVKEVE